MATSTEILDDALISGYILENYGVYNENNYENYENYYENYQDYYDYDDNNFYGVESYNSSIPQEILGHKIKQQDFAIDRFKKCIKKFVHYPEEHLDELIRSANFAYIDRHTLNKIMSCYDETEHFLSGKKSLEDYNPELYIENYYIENIFSKIGESISKTAGKIAGSVKDITVRIGKAFSSAAERVFRDAKDFFNYLLNTIMSGLSKMYDGMVEFAELVKRFGVKVKNLIVKGIHMLIDFLQTYFPSFLGKYVRCKKGEVNKLTPCESNIFEINDKQLQQFVLDKLIYLIFSLSGHPEFKIIFDGILAIPVLGTYLKSGITKIFNFLIWNHVKSLVNKLITKVIHYVDPSTKDFQFELAEWFKYLQAIENFEQDVENGEFYWKLREYMRQKIHVEKYKNCEHYLLL